MKIELTDKDIEIILRTLGKEKASTQNAGFPHLGVTMEAEKIRELILDYISLLTSSNSYDYHTEKKIVQARLLLNKEDEEKNVKEVTTEEMLESFDIKQCKMRYTGSVKTFELLNSFGVLYKGNLMWHEDCGYEVWWDTDAPDISHRPEFEHILDSILEHKYND